MYFSSCESILGTFLAHIIFMHSKDKTRRNFSIPMWQRLFQLFILSLFFLLSNFCFPSFYISLLNAGIPGVAIDGENVAKGGGGS